MLNNRLQGTALTENDLSDGPRVISFISGKGGVGKSVLAYNAGAILASQSRKTLIVDCDYSFGNIHILGNVVPEKTLADVMRDHRNFDPARTILGGNYHLIATPSHGNKYLEYKKAAFHSFVNRLRDIASGYEYIILDTPSGHLSIIEETVRHADINLIVINSELTSIADGYGLFKYLVKTIDDFSAHIFLNNVEGESDYEYVYQKFTVMAGRFLGRVPLSAGYLYSDRHIIDSVSEQRALVDIFPDSPVVRQLSNLCKILTANNVSGGSETTIKSEDNINSIKALADIKE